MFVRNLCSLLQIIILNISLLPRSYIFLYYNITIKHIWLMQTIPLKYFLIVEITRVASCFLVDKVGPKWLPAYHPPSTTHHPHPVAAMLRVLDVWHWALVQRQRRIGRAVLCVGWWGLLSFTKGFCGNEWRSPAYLYWAKTSHRLGGNVPVSLCTRSSYEHQLMHVLSAEVLAVPSHAHCLNTQETEPTVVFLNQIWTTQGASEPRSGRANHFWATQGGDEPVLSQSPEQSKFAQPHTISM